MLSYKSFISSLTTEERFNSNVRNMDNEYCKRIVNDWISKKSLVNEKYFNQRLEIEKRSRTEFAKSIQLPQENDLLTKQIIEESNWFKALNEALSKNDYNILETNVLSILNPFHKYIETEIINTVSNLENLIVDDQLLKEVAKESCTGLLKYMIKNIVLDLNQKKKDDLLRGDTSKARFENYIKDLCTNQNRLESFLVEFPVSTRIISTRMLYIVDFFTESFERLNKHFDDLVKSGFVKKSSLLSKIIFSNSDSHQQGRTVLIFQFEGNQRVVYKPRSLEAEKTFNNLVEWINGSTKNHRIDFMTMKVLDFGSYGYEEYIEYKNCKKESELADYYFRFGNLVSLIYFLRGGDFHLENLIANGSYPALIDMETLVQNVVDLDFRESATVEIKKDLEIDSVLGSALLPLIVFDNYDDGVGVNVSALNGGGDKLPFKVLMPKNINTDEFRFEYSDHYTEYSNNIPKINGEHADFSNYISEILDGFEVMSQFIFENKNVFCDKLKDFNGIQTRVILKGTNSYGQLLEYSTHPNYAKNMLEREKLLENIWAYPYKDKRAIQSEFADLLLDDIPIFFSKTNTKNLINSRGEKYNNFFKDTAFDLMKRRIDNLTQENLKYQKTLIKFRLSKINHEAFHFENNQISKNLPNLQKRTLDNLEDKVLNQIENIAIRLDETKIESKDSTSYSWSNIIKIGENIWNYGAMPIDLYGGLSGIALFFFELYSVTKKFKYKVTYMKILKEISIETPYSVPSYSAFFGKNSFYYLIINEIRKTGESSMSAHLENLYTDSVAILDHFNPYENDLDFLGIGSHIVLLARYFEISKDERIPLLIEKYCSMINCEKISELGSGFGHGKYGMRYAISEVSKVVNDQKVIKELEKRLNIENHFTNTDFGWCKGFSGELIACNEILSENEVQKIVKIWMKENGISLEYDDTLCHGIGSVIELNLILQKLGYEEIIDLNKLIGRIIESKEKLKNVDEIVAIDLFTGLTGIGYGLLRYLFPNEVTKVLLIE